MTPAAWNTWVGRIVVEELARLGTPLVCLAPGARCAPLSMALGRMERMPWTTFVDERAAAFHALGVGRATQRPAAVVTTSGTAVGNLVPAAMEADRAGIPLLLLTADRPAELRQTASNQTVLQADLLAPLVRYRLDLPCSDPGLDLRAVLSTVDQAVGAARRLRGPVHLNLQFREPLGPDEAPVPPFIAAWWADGERPWTRVDPPSQRLTSAGLARLRDVGGSPRGLVVVGSLPPDAVAPVRAALERLRWPFHATADSGIQGGIVGLDSALSDPELAARLAPDAVIWIGGHVVSKRVVHWLRDHPGPLELVAVDASEARVDPAFRVRDRLVLDLADLPAVLPVGEPSAAWSTDYQAVSTAGAEAVERAVSGWTEAAAVRAVLHASTSVFLGASLPIRLADWVGSGGSPVRMEANRGASGIDGVLATAAGWGRHQDGPIRVILGDLTCLHDQGSLPLFRGSGHQVVVLNNQGGSIFGMLPFGAVEGFDTVFRNAHPQRIAPLAAAHGLSVAEVSSPEELQAALADPTIELIEAGFTHDSTVDDVAALHTDTVHALRRAWEPDA